MRKINYMCLGLVLMLVSLIGMMACEKAADKKEAFIFDSVDYTDTTNMLIGSELPRILFANKDQVIVENRHIYIYDLKKREMVQSIDMVAFTDRILGPDFKDRCRSWVISDKEGERLIFSFSQLEGDNHKYFTYSLKTSQLEEVSQEVYLVLRDNRYSCQTFEPGDITRYEDRLDYKAQIDDQAYLYLVLSRGDFSQARVVLEDGDQYQVYSLFK